MTPAKKKNELPTELVKAAVAQLRKPEVQDQLARAALALADKLKQVKKDHDYRKRQLESDAPDLVASKEKRAENRLGSLFGTKKLERRLRNLAENVDLLRGSVDSPEARDALNAADTAVAKLETAVAMAANMPIGKRQKAHWEIDSELDELERAVFASQMA